VTGLINGQDYYFVVTASDGTITSVPSNELNAIPIPAPTEDPTLYVQNIEYNVGKRPTNPSIQTADFHLR
jgi:hypothetical protein